MQTATTYKSDWFSSKRFAAYFRLYFSSYRNKLLLAASLMLAVTTLLLILMNYNNERMYDPLYGGSSYYGGSKDYDPFWSFEQGIFILLGAIFSAIAGSWMYSTMTTKRNRLETIEIPASQFEKFLTWWLIYLPIFLATMFICFYVADILRFVWAKLCLEHSNHIHIYPLGNLLTFTLPPYNSLYEWAMEDSLLNLQLALTAFSSILGANAIFSLGSIFFHRLNFIKTVGVLFALLIVYGLLVAWGINVFEAADHTWVDMRYNGKSTAFTSCLFSAIGIVIAWFYWLGYIRYKEDELIERW